MKSLTLLTLFLSSFTLFGQSVSMSPNVGYQGDNSLPVTISGVGTSFSQGSPSLVQVTQGVNALSFTPQNLNGPTQMTGLLDIPSNAVPGHYTLTVDDAFNNHVAPGAFLVLPGNGHSVFGRVVLDINQNCVDDPSEIGVEGINVLIAPIGMVVQTGPGGYWSLPSLPVGNYELVVGGTGSWTPTCPPTQSFSVTNSNALTMAPAFGMVNTNPCPDPVVSVFAPFLRRCFTDQKVYVSACNGNMGTGTIYGAYVDLELDPFMAPTSASMPYTSLGNNVFRFDVGDVDPGNCATFWVSTHISCDAMLDQTLCMEANMYPVDPCILDTIPADPIPPGTDPNFPIPDYCTLPWDNSSLLVEGWCADDSVHFSITNSAQFGVGDMVCETPVFLYVNDTLQSIHSVKLKGQEVVNYTYAADGETWVMATEQHPLHPGSSHPNAFVEACGATLDNWIPGMVNNFPTNDADPVVDIYCGPATGSYDPNDKRGFPKGLTEDHLILPNKSIDFVIRFQNTGTDTAFNIVVRDTLDVDLDIFSVKPGVSSHNYTFRTYGPRVLEWTFANIMLPDSTTDLVGSNGFLTFKVDQMPNLENGTMITNDADIYFDFNEPIITNETWHQVDDMLQSSPVGTPVLFMEGEEVFVYPNPTTDKLFLDNSEELVGEKFIISDYRGNIVQTGILNYLHNEISLEGLSPGVYVIQIKNSIPVKVVRVEH